MTGYVHAGPTCPVQQVNASPCERLVVSAKIVVTRPDGTAVTVIVSDAAGRFSLELPAGRYLFTPQPVQGLMGVAAPISLVVAQGSNPAPLDFAYDTGIR